MILGLLKAKNIVTLLVFVLVSLFFYFGLQKYDVFLIASDSMLPVLPRYSLVFVSPGEYAVGDIVSFHPQGMYGEIFTHRILEVKEFVGNTVFTTAGDNNDYSDPFPVLQNEIVGKVEYSFNYTLDAVYALFGVLTGKILVSIVLSSKHAK